MNKVALITGGTRGIGLGIAEELAKSDFCLALNGVRRLEEVEAEIKNLKQFGVDVIYCQGNLAVSDDRKKIVDRIRNHYGRLNVLVNNAGIAPRDRKDILESSEESYDEVMNVNLKGPYFLTQALANWMISQKNNDPEYSGCIINISSISATIASTNRGEYCLSKAGLSMMTSLYATRMGEFDIPVYEVRPGITKTDMTSSVQKKYDDLLARGLCIQKRWGMPKDVGMAVTALANGHFPYSTGQVIMVDGGLTISRL